MAAPNRAFVFALLCLLAGSAAARAESAAPKEKARKHEPAYNTHVSTDKSIYRPGERVYVRGVILREGDHTPLSDSAPIEAFIAIRGPTGIKVSTGFAQPRRSVLGFSWQIPEKQPGGEYTIGVGYPTRRFKAAKRTFHIRGFRAPRLNSQIEFLRDGYGPGDRVSATLRVTRAEGGVPAGAKVTAIARVDGREVSRRTVTVDADGNCTVAFKLPVDIKRGEGSLALIIDDGGAVESATKTIPILLRTVDLKIYPEGGDLVGGLPTRVYVQARTAAGKPADVAGVVVRGDGTTVNTFRTEHEGRGRFALLPKHGTRYAIRITEPAGVTQTYLLPAVKISGASVRSLQDRFGPGQPVRLRVGAARNGWHTVTLSQHGKELTSAGLDAKRGRLQDVTLYPTAAAQGVLTATVWDRWGYPLAERLVYRTPQHAVRIHVQADRTQYVPGDSVTLRLKTTTPDGKPVGAVVGLTVTDESVLEMLETREHAPRLPVMALLEPEVRDLADAHIYLDEGNPKAPRAIDLLLGTQGWRRFTIRRRSDLIADGATRVAAVVPRRTSGDKDAPAQKPARFKDAEKPDAPIQSPGDTVAEIPLAVVPTLAEIDAHEEVIIVEHVETENDMDRNLAKGQENAISDIPLGGQGVLAAIGVGGGGAGAYGFRSGGGRKRATTRFGGSRASESAVDAALRWLARHQERNGRWLSRKHGGKMSDEISVGLTGLSLLAFLGAGHTEKIGKFKGNVRRGIAYLVQRQNEEGMIGPNRDSSHGGGYNHAIAGLALAEAYGMARVHATGQAAQFALNYSVERHQVEYDGWRYGPGMRADLSVTGWFIMQLKSAKVAGLRVPGKAWQGAAQFLDSVEVDGEFDGWDGGLFRYQPRRPATRTMTAVGMLGRLFMGHPPAELAGGSASLLESLPTRQNKNFYYWYFGTLDMFQVGGIAWREWNGALRPMLVSMQRKGGDEDGSWDPKGGPWGAKAGRVFSTALGALCLEVYYRYLPMYGAEPAAMPMRRNDFVAVRQFAQREAVSKGKAGRNRFSETVYWSAGVRTDARTGKASVQFVLSDSVTSFRAMADGFTRGGALGQATTTVTSVRPFYAEPKLPLEVSQGDVIHLPVGVVSNMNGPLTGGAIEVQAPKGMEVARLPSFTLAPNQRTRFVVPIGVGRFSGQAGITLRARAGEYTDTVQRTLTVKPSGYPIEAGSGGVVGPETVFRHSVTIPPQVVPGSVDARGVLHTSPLSNLTKALQGLIREPHGCFEQTSSTAYPLVMAQQYFLSHAGVPPEMIRESREHLQSGYQKLLGYECTTRGYECFGSDPGHEALTAYGLLEFNDMAKVMSVDETMLKRTKDWLLKRRDGRGGFTRKRRNGHQWIVDPDTSNAYILWALLESGHTSLQSEIERLKAQAAESKNTYVLALSANVLQLAGDHPAAAALMDRLAALQNKSGWVRGATTSIVGSGGVSLNVETTALTALAWMRKPGYESNIEKAMHAIASVERGGRFGSTQSTVLALRAILAYDKGRSTGRSGGRATLYVDGIRRGRPLTLDPNARGVLEFSRMAQWLNTPGVHSIEVRMDGGWKLPCAWTVRYHTATPASSPECKLRLETKLRETKLEEGALTEVTVLLRNLTDAAVPSPTAVIGLPGGLEPRHDQLRELVKKEVVSAYEVRGRDVVLYWRSLGPREQVRLAISVKAAIPGTYAGPASRAYLYYTDEHKQWVPPFRVTITSPNL